MDFIGIYGKEIISILIPFVTWILNVGIKGKAKLIWTSPHAFTFIVQEPLRNDQGNIIKQVQTVHTASIKIINVGREAANKVELIFNYKPQCINLWPVRYYEQKMDQDNRYIMIFDNLSPREEIGLEAISINLDLPAILVVRSAECIAQNVQLAWYAKVSLLRINILRVLLFSGSITVVYWFIVLLQLLIIKTPI